MTNKTPAAAGKRGRYARLADEELISLVGAGDPGAFAALYDRHARAVFSLAWRMTGERREAEDLAQDAFLKVWRSAAGYEPERGSVRTWILSVVHNRGIDRIRSSASRRRTREAAEAEAPRRRPRPRPRGASRATRSSGSGATTGGSGCAMRCGTSRASRARSSRCSTTRA